MKQSIAKRLDKLGQRLLPTAPRTIWQLMIVSSDGTQRPGPIIQVGKHDHDTSRLNHSFVAAQESKP